MAKAKLVALADELTDDLNTKDWTFKFKATRTYKPNPKLENTDALTVLVVMAATRMTPDNRTEWVYEHDADIGVLYRCGENAGVPTEKFDDCMKLCEEFADKYRLARGAGATMAGMTLTDVSFGGPTGAIYIPEHINEFNQFTGVVRLTFREWRT